MIDSCHHSYLFLSVTTSIIVYLLTFVFKFCCVRATPIWLVDNRCITVNVMQLPGHCPLHVKEAHPESMLIPKEENKGEKTSNP